MFFYTSTEIKEYIQELPRQRKSALKNYYLTHNKNIVCYSTATTHINHPENIKAKYLDIILVWLKNDLLKQTN